jgi:hypothetical protein
MIILIRTVYGDHCHIDTDDLERAQRRGRKLIPIRDGNGTRMSRPDGDLLLHIDNIADGGGP